jgi:hypothetical protein
MAGYFPERKRSNGSAKRQRGARKGSNVPASTSLS